MNQEEQRGNPLLVGLAIGILGMLIAIFAVGFLIYRQMSRAETPMATVAPMAPPVSSSAAIPAPRPRDPGVATVPPVALPDPENPWAVFVGAGGDRRSAQATARQRERQIDLPGVTVSVIEVPHPEYANLGLRPDGAYNSAFVLTIGAYPDETKAQAMARVLATKLSGVERPYAKNVYLSY